MDEPSFAAAKQLILGILSEIDVSQMATRVSVVQFSTSARLAIRLTDINSHQELSNELAQLKTISGSRNLAVGIQLALQEIQDVGRIGVTRIIYIVSSGESDDLETTANAAQSAQDNDVLLIGVGSSAARADLERIALPNLLFIADNINSLAIRQKSVEAICTQGIHLHINYTCYNYVQFLSHSVSVFSFKMSS